MKTDKIRFTDFNRKDLKQTELKRTRKNYLLCNSKLVYYPPIIIISIKLAR